MFFTVCFFNDWKTDDDFSSKRGGAGRVKIPYELIFWIVFGAIELGCILDRFFLNPFPMGVDFKPLSNALNEVPPRVTFIPGAIAFFDGFGRVAGRLFIPVFGALFWTQCKTTENFLMEVRRIQEIFFFSFFFFFFFFFFDFSFSFFF